MFESRQQLALSSPAEAVSRCCRVRAAEEVAAAGNAVTPRPFVPHCHLFLFKGPAKMHLTVFKVHSRRRQVAFAACARSSRCAAYLDATGYLQDLSSRRKLLSANTAVVQIVGLCLQP